MSCCRSLTALSRLRAGVLAGLAVLLGVLPPTTARSAGDFASESAAVAATLKGGDAAGALSAGRRLLRQAGGDDAVGATDVSALYRLLLDAAEDVPDLRTGNALAADLRRHDRQAFGESGMERLPGLYRLADWYRWAGRHDRERRVLGEAVDLITTAHGPLDARLARPLNAVVAACLAARSDEAAAREAAARARGLSFAATREDVEARADAFAAQGDIEVVFGDPAAAGGWYRAAWRTLADSTLAGPAVADGRFADPKPISVDIPEEPFTSSRGGQDHFAAGRVAFGFTVTADGQVDELRIREMLAPVDSLPQPVLRAFRDARYRPRVLAGAPVATPDHGYVLRFQRDARLQPRQAQFGIIEQVR